MRTTSYICLGILFVMTCLLGFAESVGAATVSVKQLGCGTVANCYTKINDAIFYAQQDDTIKVYPGRYEEVVVINKNLSLVGSGPQFTFIYSSDHGININQNYKSTIIGFTITASRSGIYISNSSEAIIRNNILVSNGANGIEISSNSKETIANNVISNNVLSGIATNYTGFTTPSSQPNIFNNILSTNGKYGIGVYVTGTITISYNNVYANVSGNYSGCSAGTGDISQSPAFVDAPTGNFTLLSTSTSKNAGRPGSADADLDGSRNDMGAYGGPDAVSFWPYPQGTPIITNLTATPTAVQKGGTITIKATGAVQ